MDIQTKLLYLLLDLLLPLAIGQACRSQKRLSGSFFQRMIILNICLVYPVLAGLTIWSLRLNYELIGLQRTCLWNANSTANWIKAAIS